MIMKTMKVMMEEYGCEDSYSQRWDLDTSRLYKHLDIDILIYIDDGEKKNIPRAKVVLPTALGDLEEREEETKETPVNRDLGKVCHFKRSWDEKDFYIEV